MHGISEPFELEYRGMDVFYGRGCIGQIGDYLSSNSLGTALLVCGQNVGSNQPLMELVRSGLSPCKINVFDRTTPAKKAETVFNAINKVNQEDVDVIIGLGGGSSLDIAKQVSAFGRADMSLDTLREAAKEERLDLEDIIDDELPVIVVPTTFAGADLSKGGSVELLSEQQSPTNQPVSIGHNKYPIADFLDPALFDTAPAAALRGSAMNGFNKSLETLYVDESNPVGEITAVRGVSMLSRTLPIACGDESQRARWAMNRAVLGVFLAQYECQLSIIHAFGHGFSRRYSVQQGSVHAILTPHVLSYLFSQDDANRSVIAEGLGVETTEYSDQEMGELVISEIRKLQSALDLPEALGSLPALEKEDFSLVADFILHNPLINKVPSTVDLDKADINSILHTAW